MTVQGSRRWLVVLELPHDTARDSQELVAWLENCLPVARIVAYQELVEETEMEGGEA